MIASRIDTGDVELWVVRRGEGPDVLLIAGLSDPADAWQFQLDGLADRYRLIAFDNRGAGRTPLPDGPLSVPMMADAAAALLRALEVQATHVAGFSGGPHRPGAGTQAGLAGFDTDQQGAAHLGRTREGSF